MGRSKAVDILRAIAVLLVLGRHMTRYPSSPGSFLKSSLHQFTEIWYRGGWVGVDLFFVLSGFLVSGLLFREHRKFGAISAKSFLVRRGFKIYPAFWLLILGTVIVGVVGGQFQLWPTIAELLFLQNYVTGVWEHTWSLAVEEHFYALLLLYTIFLARRNHANPFRTVPSAFCILAVLLLGLRIGTALIWNYDHKTHLFPSHLRMDSLFSGVVIAYYYHYHHERFMAWARRYRLTLFFLGVAAFVPAFIFPLETTPFISTFGLTLIYAGSGFLLIASLTLKVPDNPIWTGSAFLGSHSYSIYLWHVPVSIWSFPLQGKNLFGFGSWLLYFAAYVLGSLAFGIIMASLIEFPLLKVRDRWFPSRGRALEVSAGEQTPPTRRSDEISAPDFVAPADALPVTEQQ